MCCYRCLSIWITSVFVVLFVQSSHGATAATDIDQILELTMHPENQTPLRHDHAQFNCDARKRGPNGARTDDINIQWFHDGRLVRPSSASGRTVSRGVLFFASVHPPDTGVYWCQVSVKGSPQHFIRSRNATLRIAYLREEFLVTPASVEVAVGGTAVLECAPPDGLPIPKVEWLKEGAPVNVGSGRNSRFRIEGLGNLVISDVRATDHGGYACKADNIVGNRETPSAVLRVRPKHKPTLIITPEDKTVLVTESGRANVRFECSARGDPMPGIRWLRDGDDLLPALRAASNTSAANEDRFVVTSEVRRALAYSVLDLSDVRPDDQANYSCEAENARGRVIATARLTVHYGPQWVIGPIDQRVTVLRPLALRCLAAGNPRPEVYWSSDVVPGKQLFPNNSYGRVHVDLQGTLRIARVFPEDEGVYLCTAISPIDTITAAARVEVLDNGGVFLSGRGQRSFLWERLSAPWVVLALGAILCIVLIGVAVLILVLLRKINTRTQSALTDIPIGKSGDINFLTDLTCPTTTVISSPSREKIILYENKLNTFDSSYPCVEMQRPSKYNEGVLRSRGESTRSPLSRPYTSTTIVAGMPPVMHLTGGSHMVGEGNVGRAKPPFPVNRGSHQRAHELENLLHSGYVNSASSSSDASSFGKRTEHSSRSSRSRARTPAASPSPQDTVSVSVSLFDEPIYSLVPDEEDVHLKQINDDRSPTGAPTNLTLGQ